MADWIRRGLLVSVMVAAACGGGEQAPDPGFETGPCIAGACLGGLECVADACVVPDGSSAGSDSGEAESTTAGETTTGNEGGSSSDSDPDGTGEVSTSGELSATDSATSTGATSAVETSSAESSDGGSGGDPGWPAPEDGCDPRYLYLDPVDAEPGTLCSPSCDGWSAPCPEPLTGDAISYCGLSLDSSNAPCTTDADCDIANETCVDVADGSMDCYLPPEWCLLYCGTGETCPDGMVCAADTFCEYP